MTQLAWRGCLLLAALGAVPAHAQLPLAKEAEDCPVACAAGAEMQPNMWARGGKVTPAFWGRGAGDSVAWTLRLHEAHKGLRFGLRYSYAGPSFEAHFASNPKRTLHLVVDGGKPIAVLIPSTGSWDQFDTSVAALPSLKAGAHTLKVVSPEADMVANLDSLFLFEGAAEKLPVRMRKTIIATSPSNHFLIRATPNAPMTMPVDKVFREFERIYTHYKSFMGWAPEEPIGINLIEDERWPDPGATAFQNGAGVFFRAGVMDREQGNWLHEMTHMFYLGHFPRWFDEPSVRALTTLVWVPELHPVGADPMADASYARDTADGLAVWAQADATYDGVEPILNAILVRHGREGLHRFFTGCAEAGRKGELDFRPGRWMTKAEIVRYMSAAVGEDVAPLFHRWRGFAAAE